MKHYRILWVGYLFLFLFTTNPASSAPIFKNVTIIVSSCDKYAELWSPFFTFLFKNWPSLLTDNKHVPIILITNQETYSDPQGRVTVYQTDQDSNWSNGILNVLKNIKTDYILYLQEDYIIHKPVNEQRLNQLFAAMDKESVAYMELGADSYFLKDPQYTQVPGVALKRKQEEHRASLQAAFWRKDVLMWLLKPGEDPWQFEKDGSVRSEGMMKPFWVVVDDYPLVYLNACNGGYWDYHVLTYLKMQGVDIPARKLPIDKEHPFLRWLQQGYPITYKRLMRIRGWF